MSISYSHILAVFPGPCRQKPTCVRTPFPKEPKLPDFRQFLPHATVYFPLQNSSASYMIITASAQLAERGPFCPQQEQPAGNADHLKADRLGACRLSMRPGVFLSACLCTCRLCSCSAGRTGTPLQNRKRGNL